MSRREEIAGRLLEVRQGMGQSQREFASQLGVSQRTWSDYEQARTFPGGEVLAQLADRGVDVEWILTGKTRASAAAPLNEELLETCISGVEKHLADRRQTLPPKKKATLISLLYMEVLERERESPHTAKPGGEALGDLIGRFVRLAS